MLAAEKQTVGSTKLYRLEGVTPVGSQNAGTIRCPTKRLEFILERRGVPRKNAKRLAKRFLDLVPPAEVSRARWCY
jgi:hypothetical protein